MLCMTSLADPLHTLCLHMYSVFRGAEECDMSVTLLETLTRLSPKAFLLVCSRNQLVQIKKHMSRTYGQYRGVLETVM
jgi:hypothetical protein